jgi:hypothetical protein
LCRWSRRENVSRNANPDAGAFEFNFRKPGLIQQRGKLSHRIGVDSRTAVSRDRVGYTVAQRFGLF